MELPQCLAGAPAANIGTRLQWLEGMHFMVMCNTRQSRIQAWRKKIRESAEGSKKYVFQHLKHKSSDEPPNLITDPDGNILYQPFDALSEFNAQWDQVFGANALHEDPHTILRVVWPYVSHLSQQPHLPEITARDLCEQIHRRKPEAAPGLDGWRTVELQRLPWFALVPVAGVFNQIEQELTPLPPVLTIAKQMVLKERGPIPYAEKVNRIAPGHPVDLYWPSLSPTTSMAAISDPPQFVWSY